MNQKPILALSTYTFQSGFFFGGITQVYKLRMCSSSDVQCVHCATCATERHDIVQVVTNRGT